MSLRRLNGEWIRWLLLVALVVATNFLDVRYVPKGIYGADQEKTSQNFAAVKEAIANMTTAIALLQKTERALEDHESRIRRLETRNSAMLNAGPATPAAHFNSSVNKFYYEDAPAGVVLVPDFRAAR